MWNWTFRDAVSPVLSSTGSGFPIVLKERALLSNVRNHHQPSCALLFYNVTLCAANLVDSTCLKKRNFKEKRELTAERVLFLYRQDCGGAEFWISKALDLWCGKGTRLSVRLHQQLRGVIR